LPSIKIGVPDKLQETRRIGMIERCDDLWSCYEPGEAWLWHNTRDERGL